MAIVDFFCYSLYWQLHLVEKNGDMTFLLLELILADQLADPPLLVTSSGQEGLYDFLLLELILADQLPDLPLVVASSGQEWQYDISTVRAHIGRLTGRSTPPH